MQNRFAAGLGVALAAVGILAGCQGAQNKPNAENAPPPTAPAATPSPAATPVPAALSGSAELAENVYDAVWQKDWKTADAKFQQLERSAAQAEQAGSGSATEIKDKVGQLKDALHAKKRTESLRTSNQLTDLFTSAMRPYQNNMPVDVMKLDYLGRRLQVDAATHDLRAARLTVREIDKSWEGVRPAVEGSNGKAEAANFAALVKKMEVAPNTKRMAALAKDALAQVDKLEGVFTKKP